MRTFLDICKWFLIVFFASCISGCGPDSEVKNGAEELPSGALVNYHPNGTKKLEEFYQGDLRHGLSTTWDVNGTIIEQLRYENGKLVETLVGNRVEVGGK
jgi:hypothetical protein